MPTTNWTSLDKSQDPAASEVSSEGLGPIEPAQTVETIFEEEISDLPPVWSEGGTTGDDSNQEVEDGAQATWTPIDLEQANVTPCSECVEAVELANEANDRVASAVAYLELLIADAETAATSAEADASTSGANATAAAVAYANASASALSASASATASSIAARALTINLIKQGEFARTGLTNDRAGAPGDVAALSGGVFETEGDEGIVYTVTGEADICFREVFDYLSNRNIRLTVRARQEVDNTTGGSAFYAGFVFLDEDYAILSTNFPVTVADFTAADGWVTYESEYDTSSVPMGTAYIRGIVLVNDDAGDGVVQLSQMFLEDYTLTQEAVNAAAAAVVAQSEASDSASAASVSASASATSAAGAAASASLVISALAADSLSEAILALQVDTGSNAATLKLISTSGGTWNGSLIQMEADTIGFRTDSFQVYNGSSYDAVFTINGGVVQIKEANIVNLSAAKITTGFLDAARIQSASITGTHIAASTITATNIAASTITASEMNVSSLSSISANLGTVTAGNLSADLITAGTLNVDRINTGSIITEKLEDDCVSKSSGSSTDSSSSPSNNTWTSIASTSLTTVGGPVKVIAGTYGVGTSNVPTWMELRIKRDSTVIRHVTATIAHPDGTGDYLTGGYITVPEIDDAPAAGTYTYSLEVYFHDANASRLVDNRTIIATEFRR